MISGLSRIRLLILSRKLSSLVALLSSLLSMPLDRALARWRRTSRRRSLSVARRSRLFARRLVRIFVLALLLLRRVRGKLLRLRASRRNATLLLRVVT